MAAGLSPEGGKMDETEPDDRARSEVAELRTALRIMQARVDELEAGNAALRIEVTALAGASGPSVVHRNQADGRAGGAGQQIGRRRALRTGLAAAGAAVVAGGALLDSEPGRRQRQRSG